MTTLLMLCARLRLRRCPGQGHRAGDQQRSHGGATAAGASRNGGATRLPTVPRAVRTSWAQRAGRAAAALGMLTAAGCGGHASTAAPPARSPSTGATSAPASAGTPRTPSPTATTVAPAAPGQWHQVFADDFSGSALNRTSWTTCYDWNVGGCTNSDTGESEWYLPGQATVGNGRLTLTAVRAHTVGADHNGYPWRSGMVSTGRDSWDAQPHRTFTHGYFAARIQVPAAAGMFPAFWLMPDTKATPPELDIIEFIGGTRTAIMTVHWTGPDGGDLHTGRHYRGPADFAAGFHVFALDWEQNSLTWYIDGVRRLVVTDHVPQVPMEMLLTLAVGFPAMPPASVDSAQMKVDWVRVWQH